MTPADYYERMSPGALLLMICAPPRYHRTVCAVEDAGFEIRDCIMYLFDDGARVAYEPICVARKPPDGTMADNMSKYGCGALHIDNCRVETDELKSRLVPASSSRGNSLEGSVDGSLRKEWFYDGSKGRWPANVIHDGSARVMAQFARSKAPDTARYFICCPDHTALLVYLRKLIGTI